MKKFLMCLVLLVFVMAQAEARFGGGSSSSSSRSSFSSSSSSRSSFSSSSPSRSFFGRSGSPATITRPSAPAPQAVAPSVSRTTVIHHTNYVDHGSHTNGLVTGMLIGHAMSNNRPQVVYVNGQPQQQVVYADNQQGSYNDSQAPQQTIVQKQPESHWLAWTFGILAMVGACFFIFRIFL